MKKKTQVSIKWENLFKGLKIPRRAFFASFFCYIHNASFRSRRSQLEYEVRAKLSLRALRKIIFAMKFFIFQLFSTLLCKEK
jgi:hypothetical protein